MLGAFNLEEVDVLSILTASTVSKGTRHSPDSFLLSQEWIFSGKLKNSFGTTQGALLLFYGVALYGYLDRMKILKAKHIFRLHL